MKTFKIVFLSLLVLPLLAIAQKTDMAKVITSNSNGAKCISPVHILKIDGRETKVQRMGFDLEPGKHTLSGSALINSAYCQTVGQTNSRYKATPLEAEFEAGKTYWVGIDHSSRDKKEWKYVVWQVKDTK